MAATIWTVPGASNQEAKIFQFLKEAQYSVRVVEVRLFKNGSVFNSVPIDQRRWQPVGDFRLTAKRRERASSRGWGRSLFAVTPRAGNLFQAFFSARPDKEVTRERYSG
jgi:hypothetical protein